jgi:hypothetical protein
VRGARGAEEGQFPGLHIVAAFELFSLRSGDWSYAGAGEYKAGIRVIVAALAWPIYALVISFK